MRIVINTNYEAPGTKVCVDDLIPRLLKAGHNVVKNDWDNYGNYDLALFMSPDSEVAKAKARNSKIVCGIMDPKIDTKKLRNNTRQADFIVVSSLEQREALFKYNDNIFIYFMFPQIKAARKTHEDKKGVKIGFHGNIEHLDAFNPNITKALDSLADEMHVELVAVYNIEKFGQWKMGVPRKARVRHVQWRSDTFCEELLKCDIGIANNVIYQRNFFLPLDWLVYYIRRAGVRFNRPVNPNDYLLRFKYSANPGRLYVFAQLGIPVVSDFAPSSSQFIRDGETGFIVNTERGWFMALKHLALSASRRQSMGDGLREFINQNYSIDRNFDRFNDWLLETVRTHHEKPYS